ncbi:MAG: FMN phosphatase YigB (HAD superfamily) [Glaciecola sp.]|jgi:FMN phosphatase YigB (HAD superfamily)
MRIKNLILDLGGVLYDLDYGKTQNALVRLGLENSFSQLTQSSLFDDLEEGTITSEFFINQLISLSDNQNVQPQQVIDAWNAMLLGMPAEKFELLKELKGSYNLYLYSNTNAIHIKEVWRHYKISHGVDNLDGFFLKVYLSNEINIRKPKTAGFDLIVKENNLIKEETLFIDDSPQHVKGAKLAGIHSFWLDLKKEDLRLLLSRKGLLGKV